MPRMTSMARPDYGRWLTATDSLACTSEEGWSPRKAHPRLCLFNLFDRFWGPEWRVGPYAASSALKTEIACLVAEDGLTDVEKQLIASWRSNIMYWRFCEAGRSSGMHHCGCVSCF